MLIGKLVSASGFSRDTIRYYEKLGLLQLEKSDRQPNNYKNYSPKVLERLEQIRQLKELGFTLTEIASLLEALATRDEPCAELPAQLDQKIGLLEKKIDLLQQYRDRLVAVRAACGGACGAAQGLPDCFTPRCC
jgi:DNA-binding transcriptional MerR regulator